MPRSSDACVLFEYSSWITDVSALFVDHTVTPWPPYSPLHTGARTTANQKKTSLHNEICVTLYLIVLRSCRGDGELLLRDERGKWTIRVSEPPRPTKHSEKLSRRRCDLNI